jgi:tRNA threonylcarbamoyladenosine biosynthesis protein TsaB
LVILGIDSSDEFLSVGLAGDDGIIISKASEPRSKNKNTLHQFIKVITEEAGINLANIDGVALAIGPGSFTGLRVGLAVAKGICWSLNLPMAGVSSLVSIAWCAEPGLRKLLAIKDAKRNEFYYARYENNGQTILQEISDTVGPADDVLNIMVRGYVAIGPGVPELKKYAPIGIQIADERYDREILGGTVAKLGILKIKHGDILDVSSAAPNYIRTPRPVERVQ